MVSFRFHLVSLTAVFLALALGITMGVTVIDQATVDELEERIEDVDQRARETSNENQALVTDMGHWRQYAEGLAPSLLTGRLNGRSILIVTVEGAEGDTLQALLGTIAEAGAALQGTVSFTGKMALKTEGDVKALSEVLSSSSQGGQLRRQALSQVATGWGTGEGAPLLALLVDAGFVKYDPPPTGPVELGEIGRGTTGFVVLSGPRPEVPNPQLALPFTSDLVRSGLPDVLAVEPRLAGDVLDDDEARFVTALRADGEVSGQLSTVDNIDDVRGRVAAVIALQQLGEGELGHFGVGAGAQGPVPALGP